MQSRVLLLLAAAAFLAVQGMPQVQEASPATTPMPEEPQQSSITVDDLSSSATNGSTLEDIMQEMHFDIRYTVHGVACVLLAYDHF